MNLTDVVSHAGFSGYAQIGFVISLAAFLGVVAWVFLRPKDEMRDRAQAVLDDEADVRSDGGMHERRQQP
jgi:cbb3-type cytochrome oxidase subunit 3